MTLCFRLDAVSTLYDNSALVTTPRENGLYPISLSQLKEVFSGSGGCMVTLNTDLTYSSV